MVKFQKKLLKAGCDESLAESFKKFWVELDEPGETSTYTKNLLAELKQRGYNHDFLTNRMHAWSDFCRKACTNENDVKTLTMFELRRGEFAVPPEVGTLTALKTLILTGHVLNELPTELGDLAALEALYVGRNRLAELPPELGKLMALESLDLESNLLNALLDSIRHLRNLTRLNLDGNQFARFPDVLLDLPATTEIFLRDNPLPREEIIRIHAEARRRQERGQGVPQLILPPLPAEEDLENALRNAARDNFNAHTHGLTSNIARRLALLAEQLPQHLRGDIEAQRTEMHAIRQRLEHALAMHGAEQPPLTDAKTMEEIDEAAAARKAAEEAARKAGRKAARKAADRMFATGMGSQSAYYNDYRKTAGHVLSYVFLALEKQWEKTPAEYLPEAQANGIRQLIDRLAAGHGMCDTRLIDEVFQLVNMSLSPYADAHPEIVIRAPHVLSRDELRDILLPVAKDVLAHRMPALGAASDEQEAFRTAFADAMRQHEAIKPEEWQAYQDDEIFACWDEFKEAADDRASSSTVAEIASHR